MEQQQPSMWNLLAGACYLVPFLTYVTFACCNSGCCTVIRCCAFVFDLLSLFVIHLLIGDVLH